MGRQRTFDVIRHEYYWPNLFKQIHQHVVDCLVCQTRSLQKVKQPLQETDFPHYTMAKLSLWLSGPYLTTIFFFFLLFNRDVVLPVDNLLKPRRKNVGEETHLIALQEQHKSSSKVNNRVMMASYRSTG